MNGYVSQLSLANDVICINSHEKKNKNKNKNYKSYNKFKQLFLFLCRIS